MNGGCPLSKASGRHRAEPRQEGSRMCYCEQNWKGTATQKPLEPRPLPDNARMSDMEFGVCCWPCWMWALLGLICLAIPPIPLFDGMGMILLCHYVLEVLNFIILCNLWFFFRILYTSVALTSFPSCFLHKNLSHVSPTPF